MKEPSIYKIRIKHLLVAGVCLQIALTIGIYVTGASQKFPNLVDSNGVATAFASDGVLYLSEAQSLKDRFVQGGVVAWFKEPGELHTRIYSLFLLSFGPLFGSNILAVAPLNALYFLVILCLVFGIGREAFDERAGILAVATVMLWPSFLLHSTQLLRDQLFIVSLLVVILIGIKWLKNVFTWKIGVASGAAACVACLVIWRTRSETWDLIIAIVLLLIAALVIRQVIERKLLLGNTIGALLLLLIAFSVPRLMYPASYLNAQIPSRRLMQIELDRRNTTPPEKRRSTVMPGELPARITALRERFSARYPVASSNLDTDVILSNTADIIYYLPRAAAIGFFAPFPNMWFDSGQQTGRAGRMLGGFETLAMYCLQLMAAIALWVRRRQISTWLLWLIAAVSLTALGLVVTNLGTLYRMRFPFWMLLIILGAEGLNCTLSFFRSRRQRCGGESTSLPPDSSRASTDGVQAFVKS